MTTNESPVSDEEMASMIRQPLLNEEDNHDDEESAEKKKSLGSNHVEIRAFRRFLRLGGLTGFLIQVVSLGAYALMLMFWGEHPLEKTAQKHDWFFYAILSILTQIDLCIYVLIWMAFTCTMTRSGMAMLRNQYSTLIRRRYVFVLGVNFLVGIVLGAFMAWTLIDIYLGFPIPFLPIIGTVLVDLVLCYLMVWCYDLGKEEETIEDEERTACF